jgi:Glyoxalase/Bleomycin resistance protein/Dioxygenase superfamily
MPRAMNKIYHIGFAVLRLEEAMEEYGKIFGITFCAPVSRNYHMVEQRSEDGRVYNGPFDGRFTYSVEGPVHIELIEVSGDGIWSPSGERIHHFGMWSIDPLLQARELESVGFRWEARLHSDDGSVPIVFVRKEDIRVELLNESRRPNFVDWVEGRRGGP